MTLAARTAQAPRWVTACWAVAAVGGAVLVLSSSPTQASQHTLGPSTLASYLQRVVGPHAHEVRVNGVYGSAHDGAWQFVAHLTWRDAAGSIHGGTTDLPTLAGAATLPSEFGDGRLSAEEDIGWSLHTLDLVLGKVQHT